MFYVFLYTLFIYVCVDIVHATRRNRPPRPSWILQCVWGGCTRSGACTRASCSCRGRRACLAEPPHPLRCRRCSPTLATHCRSGSTCSRWRPLHRFLRLMMATSPLWTPPTRTLARTRSRSGSCARGSSSSPSGSATRPWTWSEAARLFVAGTFVPELVAPYGLIASSPALRGSL